MKVVAIIPAAGTGVRMGADLPKQFLSLEGTPIFVYTLRKFMASDIVTEVFLGLRADDRERAEAQIAKEKFTKPLRLVAGGFSRQETVGNALSEAPDDTDVVVVHDAVRPFVDREILCRVVEAASEHGAAIAGIPSVDTVKQVERRLILSTVPRERILLAQTPQAFRFPVLKDAYRQAAADGFTATDESGLVERLGHPVKVFMGSDHNIKITKPSDLPLARLFLSQEKEKEKAL